MRTFSPRLGKFKSGVSLRTNDEPGRTDLRIPVATVVASVLAYECTLLIGFSTGYWAAITAVVVCQSEVDATVRAARDRIIGTALGVTAGWLTAVVWHSHILVFAAALLIVLLICDRLNLQTAGRLAAVAMSIVVLVHRTVPVWRTAVDRFVEVSIGIIASLIVISFTPKREVKQS